MIRAFKTDAIVIKRKNIGESDKLITVLTKRFGKIQIKAIGIRKITSRRSPHVEPLNLTSISFYKGKGIPILTEADSRNSFSEIKKDLKKVAYAYYACELIDCLCPNEQEVGQIFCLLENLLGDISDGPNTLSLIKEFEIDLLNNLGFINPKVENEITGDLSILVEQIIERKLKTKQILPRLI
jgi:DNA repair protein RecO (recombination protein O)